MRRIILLSIFVIFLFSCEEKNQTITNEEVESFIERFDKAVITNDKNFFNNSISYFYIEDEAKKKGILNGDLGVILDLGSHINSQVFSSGEFVFTGKTKLNNETYILTYRILSEADFNYYDFTIKKKSDRLYIVDIYLYSQLEPMSEQIFSFLRKDQPIDYGINRSVKQWVDEINIKLTVKNYNKAKELFDKLLVKYDSDELGFLQFKRNFGQNLSDTALVRNVTLKLNEFEPKNKKFISRNNLMYHNSVGKNQKQRREVINDFRKIVGDDSLLNFFDGNSYFIEGDLKNAELKYDQVIKTNPRLPFAYQELIKLYIIEKEYSKALKIFEILNEKFVINRSIDDYFKDYPEFRNSQEYKKVMLKNE